MKLLLSFLLLLAVSSFGAVPSYTVFRGTGGILITSNPPIGNITIDGSGIFTSSGTNATIAISTNGVLVMVSATNVNFITGSNVFLAATNIGSTAHIGIHGMTAEQVTDIVEVFLLTYILPVLAVDTLTVSNLLVSPPNASVQYNSNGIMRGSAGFIYTNGQVRVADIVVAGQGMEITAGSLILRGGDTALASWDGKGNMRWPSSGVVRFEDQFSLNMNRIQLGGDTEAFPAIGRTNGDVIILGANGKFKAGDATNKLRAPAVFIANDSGMGTPLLRLENPLNGIGWDLAINSNPETFLLGLGRFDENYAMVWELTSGNVGIGITNPTVRLDVQGRFMARSNVYFPNISSNATPVALLATDSDGQVYETAITSGGGSALNIATNGVKISGVATQANFVAGLNIKLSGTNASDKVSIGIALTDDVALAGGLSVTGGVLLVSGATFSGGADFNDEAVFNAAVMIPNITSNPAPIAFLATDADGRVYETAVPTVETNAVLTNLVGTVGRNVTNVVSLSTSNATSKPLTNSYTSGVLTVFGLEGGSGVTIAPNGSNLVISSSASAVAPPISSVQFNSNGVMQGSAGFVFTNGLVGIGTAFPLAALSISNATATTPLLRIMASNNPTPVVIVNSNGQVGIGEAVPNAKLQVLSTVSITTVGSGRVLNVAGQGGVGRVTEIGLGPLAGVSAANSPTLIGALTRTGSSFGNADLYFATRSLTTDTPAIVRLTIQNDGNVGIGTNTPADARLHITADNSVLNVLKAGTTNRPALLVLTTNGAFQLDNITASRIATWHSDKTLTNGATTVALLDNFFAMGISNIVAADANLVIRTNAGVLTVSNAMASGGAAFSGHSNAIPYINAAGTALTYYDPGNSQTNPGFGFNPGISGGTNGYGGLMVFANESQGLLTIGHPLISSGYSTLSTALCVSNRYASSGGPDVEGAFKNDMVKIEAVMMNGANALRPDSTLTRWRVWQFDTGNQFNTSSNDVAEITVGGRISLAGGISTFKSNGVASASITVGASSFNWTNNIANTGLTNNIFVYVDGSASTTTAVAKNGQQLFSALALQAATVPLKPNERITLTYTGTAPTARWDSW